MEGMYVLGGSRSSGGKRAGPTIYELNAGGQGRSARDIPRLAGAGLLVPVALLALIPGWLASGRRGRAFYHFGVVMTPRDRERSYLAGLLTGRDPAKEVRAFGLAAFLRARHDRLYDERIEQMRRISTRQMRGDRAGGRAGRGLSWSLGRMRRWWRLGDLCRAFHAAGVAVPVAAHAT